MNDTTVVSRPKPADTRKFDRSFARVPIGLETRHPARSSALPPQGLNFKSAHSAEFETCPSPRLKSFWMPAQAELRSGQRWESRVWIVLSLTSAVLILYAAYCSL